MVVPRPNGLVGAAGDDDGLLETNVKRQDTAAVGALEVANFF